jgi:hypothetical protein
MCGTLFLIISGPRYEPETIHHVSPSFEAAVVQADIIRGSEVGKYVDTVSIRAVAVGPGPGVVVARWVANWHDGDRFHGPLSEAMEVWVKEEEPADGWASWGIDTWNLGCFQELEWNRTL